MQPHRSAQVAKLSLLLQLTLAGCFMEGYAGLRDLDASGAGARNDSAAEPADQGIIDSGSAGFDAGSDDASLSGDAAPEPTLDGGLPGNCLGDMCFSECDGEPICEPQCLAGLECVGRCGSSPRCINVCPAETTCHFDCASSADCSVTCE